MAMRFRDGAGITKLMNQSRVQRGFVFRLRFLTVDIFLFVFLIRFLCLVRIDLLGSVILKWFWFFPVLLSTKLLSFCGFVLY